MVLDPWEVRYAGEFKINDQAGDLNGAILTHLGETISRERPQAIVVSRTDKLLLRAVKRISRTLKLPFLEFSKAEVARLNLGKIPSSSTPASPTCLRLVKTLALARAGVNHLVRLFYDQNQR